MQWAADYVLTTTPYRVSASESGSDLDDAQGAGGIDAAGPPLFTLTVALGGTLRVASPPRRQTGGVVLR